MTAHPAKPTITPERIAWFAEYRSKHLAWGAFHVTLDDGNWKIDVDPAWSHGEPGEEEAIVWFNKLTASQRRRLARKIENLGRTA